MSEATLPRAIEKVSGDRRSTLSFSASVRSMFEIGTFFDRTVPIV